MSHAAFDPSGAVTFELSAGKVHVKDAPSRLLVPAEALGPLCEAAGQDATKAFGHAIGHSMGRRLALRLSTPGAPPSGSALSSVSVETFVDHLCGEFALTGMGLVSLEQWGRALLFAVDHSTAPSGLVASVLEGALDAATERKAACVAISESETRTRFLVTNGGTADRIRAWLSGGTSWGEVLIKLHNDDAQPRGET